MDTMRQRAINMTLVMKLIFYSTDTEEGGKGE